MPPGCCCITWLRASATPVCSDQAPPAIEVKASSKPIVAPLYGFKVEMCRAAVRLSRRHQFAVRVRRLAGHFNVRRVWSPNTLLQEGKSRTMVSHVLAECVDTRHVQEKQRRAR